MKKYIIFVSVAIILLFMNNACTLIGGYIGYKNREVEYKKSDNEILNLSVDEEIKIIKQRGDTVAGNFVKVNKISYKDYSKSYNDYLENQKKKFFLPILNQTYTAPINNYKTQITFKGFDFGSIYYNSPSERVNKSLLLKNIEYLKDSTDKKYATESLQYLINENKIPLYSQIVLQKENSFFDIQSEDISKIVTKSGLGIIGGMALGAIVDVLVIFIIKDMFTLNLSGLGWGGKK